VVNPPPDAALVALSLPLIINAGPVNGTALAFARSGDALYYLVDNAAVDGPPVWVAEAEVEKCALAPLFVRRR
jgi:hypothetical protein